MLVNGQPGEIFSPSKDLRQGDSISPYLYLICAGNLSFVLNEAETSYKIKGIKVTRGSLPFNYMFFVDDSILFCIAKTSDWQAIQDVLETYETAVGKEIG